MQPVRDHNLSWVWFYMVFMLFGAFLIMDLFVGAVVESFNEMRWQAGGTLFLTKNQQMWAKTQRIALRVRPRQRVTPQNHKIAAISYKIVRHKYFEPGILICVGINTLVMALEVSTAYKEYFHKQCTALIVRVRCVAFRTRDGDG